MIVAVASGKGGTGKTIVATALAVAVGGKTELCFVDADVEAPNASLLLNPHITDRYDVYVDVPLVDEALCDRCGVCAQECRFNALAVLPDKVMVFDNLCHSCGTCEIVCPRDAIKWRQRCVGWVREGYVEIDGHHSVDFFEGCMSVGEARAVPLIKALEERIHHYKKGDIIIDAGPGVGCGVMATLSMADFVLLVTEPTPFGMSDLVMAVEAVRHIGLPAGVVVNRSTYGDLPFLRRQIKRLGLSSLLELPYDAEVAEGYSKGRVVFEVRPEWRLSFEHLWDKICQSVLSGDG